MDRLHPIRVHCLGESPSDAVLQRHVPGAERQPHARVPGGYFLQKDSGPQIAEIISAFAAP